MKTCRTCGARIRWVITESGSRMPVDAEPSPRGNVLVDAEGQAVIVSDLDRVKLRGQGAPLYASHFSTCPHANRHRKRSREEQEALW